MMKFSNI